MNGVTSRSSLQALNFPKIHVRKRKIFSVVRETAKSAVRSSHLVENDSWFVGYTLRGLAMPLMRSPFLCTSCFTRRSSFDLWFLRFLLRYSLDLCAAEFGIIDSVEIITEVNKNNMWELIGKRSCLSAVATMRGARIGHGVSSVVSDRIRESWIWNDEHPDTCVSLRKLYRRETTHPNTLYVFLRWNCFDRENDELDWGCILTIYFDSTSRLVRQTDSGSNRVDDSTWLVDT